MTGAEMFALVLALVLAALVLSLQRSLPSSVNMVLTALALLAIALVLLHQAERLLVG